MNENDINRLNEAFEIFNAAEVALYEQIKVESNARAWRAGQYIAKLRAQPYLDLLILPEEFNLALVYNKGREVHFQEVQDILQAYEFQQTEDPGMPNLKIRDWQRGKTKNRFPLNFIIPERARCVLEDVNARDMEYYQGRHIR